MINNTLARLLLYIKAKGLSTGNKLPSERILADEIGLNRTSLREGLAVMEFMRYIERRPGRGAYLLDVSTRGFEGTILSLLQQDGISLADAAEVFEAVVSIESVISKLAAERRGEKDIEYLRRLNNEMGHLIDKGHNTYLHDIEFHRKIALMSGNKFLIEISTAFWLRLPMYIRIIQEGREQAEALLQHHRLIVGAIEEGDPVKTESLVKLHYRYGMDFVTRHRSELGII
ncbi:MAG: FadR/GntR family transcriptional regulator [Candidatus Saccharibacteria bacterium]